MKRFPAILTIATVALSAISCQSDEDRIQSVAQKYLEATANYRLDDAMPYATRETREESLPFIRNVVMPMTDSNYIKSNVPATIRIDSITLLSDTALVHYTKTTPIQTMSNAVVAIKEDGQWLIDAPLQLAGEKDNRSLMLNNMQYTISED